METLRPSIDTATALDEHNFLYRERQNNFLSFSNPHDHPLEFLSHKRNLTNHKTKALPRNSKLDEGEISTAHVLLKRSNGAYSFTPFVITTAYPQEYSKGSVRRRRGGRKSKTMQVYVLMHA